MIAAMVLAAGKSERMGFPKALLEFGGRTFLDRVLRLVDACQDGTASVVVVGRHAAEIKARYRDVPLVSNPDYELGMTTSFQAGIRALPQGTTSVVVFLIDHPLVKVSTVKALLRRVGTAEIVVPAFRGRRGHPVVFSRRIMDEILQLPPDVGVHTVVRRDPSRVAVVAVEDSGVVADIDTPEDFQRLSGGDGD